MMRPPMPPLPPRHPSMSAEDYLKMKIRHEKMEREHRESEKWEEALLIVCGAIIFGMAIIVMCMPLYFQFGWRGPLAIPAIGGLIWVAIYQVRQRL